MQIDKKSLALGIGVASLLIVGAIAAFLGYFLFSTHDYEQPYREQALPSGQRIKVISFHLLWGIEHDERHSRDDTFGLEYAPAVPSADPGALDAEVLQVFELVRPISEQWGFDVASISAFPTTKRKGRYDIYSFKRGAQGTWTFERKPAKVFVND